MSNNIDIAGLNIREIVELLWENAEYSPSNKTKIEFDWKIIKKELRPNGYLENGCGKILKILISSKYIDSSKYDNIYGPDKAKNLLDKLKNIE